MCESTFLAVPWKITGDNWSCACELVYFVSAGFLVGFSRGFFPKRCLSSGFSLGGCGPHPPKSSVFINWTPAVVVCLCSFDACVLTLYTR